MDDRRNSTTSAWNTIRKPWRLAPVLLAIVGLTDLAAATPPQPAFFANPNFKGDAVKLGVGSYTSAGLEAKGIVSNSIS